MSDINKRESLSQALEFLSQLETLSFNVDAALDDLWTSLFSLNVKRLNVRLRLGWNGLIVLNASMLSQALISRTPMEWICIDVNAPIDLLEALYGLNINRLCLCGSAKSLEVNRVSLLFKSLSSLSQLEEMCINVENDSPGLWEALYGLNIKRLNISIESTCLHIKHISSWLTFLSSLKQLKELSMYVALDFHDIFDGLTNFSPTVKCVGGAMKRKEFMSLSVLSLPPLETLTLYVYEYHDIWFDVPPTLKYLTIHCMELTALKLHFLLSSLLALNQTIEINLEFGLQHLDERLDNPLGKYRLIRQELGALNNVVVTRFKIFTKYDFLFNSLSDFYPCDYYSDDLDYLCNSRFYHRNHYAKNSLRVCSDSDWYVYYGRDFQYDNDDHIDDHASKTFLSLLNDNVDYRISMRLQVNPASNT
ncbi:hypothetical protein DPMN_164698 [Dreissena polymorpha]|uniref:Uncharacterized protein n=1 Tax=Dreissena polymorpha TaxID=45954 RepID=A0A9D4ISK6_DREPO|nr:hypothetical protein DPMN_164698 [Dreissena polymorpha]